MPICYTIFKERERYIKMIMYELSCRYDARKSFYGKAKIVECESGKILLYSYDTLVARINKGKFELNVDVPYYLLYSNTTLRHIKEFYKQHYKYEEITKSYLEKFESDFMVD